MGNVTVSLCLIARNEAENIARCIKSAKDFVDEIIVVDTGSSDKTIEIATSLGAKVIKEDWKNDFSLHRNTSIENASGDWIFFLDCDEELVQKSGKVIREVVQDDSFEAYFIQITNRVSTGNATSFPSIRLFKNRKSYRFEGMLHEQIVNSILSKNSSDKIGQTNINVIHHGYNPGNVNIQAKIKRNLDILLQYPEEKRNGFFFYNLGTEYLRLGKKKKALKNYLEALELTKPGQSYGPILVKKTITTLMELKRYRDAVEQLCYYQSIYKDFKDLILLEAFCHLKCGRYLKAKSYLKKYETINNRNEMACLYPEEDGYCGLTYTEMKGKIESLAIEKDYPEISVCIIGWNEADNLTRCIQSINEIAAQVIFVNNCSDDNSYALAYQLGAEVYNFEWNNNFSEIKNYALEHVNGEWVLFIDADEVLYKQGRQKIVDLIRETETDGFDLKITTFMDSVFSLSNCIVKKSCRLFRNGSYRYQGVCYETVKDSLLEAGGIVKPADIQINHLHFGGDEGNIVLKKKRKINTIKLEVKNPTKKNYWLGLEYFRYGNYKLAAEHFEKIYGKIDRGLVSDFIYYYSQSLVNINDYERAVEVLDQAVKSFSDYTDLYYLQAITLFMTGDIEKAKKLFERCLEMGDVSWHKYIMNPGTGSFKALCSLATIYIQKGDSKKALELLLEASSFPGGYRRAIEGIVQVFTGLKMDLTLEDYLRKQELFDLETLVLIVEIFSEMGVYEKSLDYLDMAYECGQLPQLLQSIESIIYNFTVELKNELKNDSSLKKVVERHM